MTPKELSAFFMRHRYHLKMDSWISPSGKTKWKLAKNSLQKFVDSGEYGWMKVLSVYYKDITLDAETDKFNFKGRIL